MPKQKKPPDNGEDFTMDEEQFTTLLHKMFPKTKNLKGKINEMNEITKKMDKEEEEKISAIDSDDDDEEESDMNTSDEEECDEYDNQPINIIVTMGDFNDYYDENESLPEDYSEDDYEWSDIDDDDDDDEENKVVEKPRSPIVTRSKSKNKKTKPEKEKESKQPKSKKKEKEKKKEKNNHELIIEEMLKSLSEEDDSSEISKKIKIKMEEHLKKEKEKLEKIEKEKEEKEEKKIKQKNEKSFRRIFNKRKNINSYEYFKKQSVVEQEKSLKMFEDIEENNKVEKPYSFIIAESQLPIAYKTIAIKKLKMFENMEPGASDYYKNKMWVDTFMEIPFSKYAKLPVALGKSTDKEIIDFMKLSMETLDKVAYGLDDAKMQIMQIIGKWIANPDSVGNAFAINGPPGTGKTTLIKDGISKILNRPFAFIPLGGATDSSYLEGHSYTYEGSIWGKIVQIIIDSKVMNPVIYFDELDKVSNSPRGEEIIGILTHLTDTSQNSQFHDKYFSGIDFDLSKALFIFSYNDESLINPILKDRMYRIITKGYNNQDKQVISNKYILPSILKSINFEENDIIINNDVMDYINQNLTENEKGVRNMKRCIETICSKLNLIRLSKNPNLIGKDIDIIFETPYTVTINDVHKLIKVNKNNDFPAMMYT
jgi:ATP-dependent Lon protease